MARVVPAEAAELAAAHLAKLDAARPKLVVGVYLTGSVALGDFVPGLSDIDFIALTNHPVEPRDHATLAWIHEDLRASTTTMYDGVYVERAVLRRPPIDSEVAPHVLEGRYRASEPCFQLSPITWIELRDQGFLVRGDLEMAHAVPPPHRDVLNRWLLGNLHSYWLGLARTMRSDLSDHVEPVSAESLIWAALGPGRLHYTLATGRVISKTDAGNYTAHAFPKWQELTERCVRARAGEQTQFTVTDVAGCCEMIEAIVEDATSRWG